MRRTSDAVIEDVGPAAVLDINRNRWVAIDPDQGRCVFEGASDFADV